MLFEAQTFLFWLGMVVHHFNPKIWEGEAEGSLISRPAWSTLPVSGYPEIHKENLPQKQNKTFFFFYYEARLTWNSLSSRLSLPTHPPPPNSGIIDACATMPNIFNMFWEVQSWWSVTDLFSFVAHASMLYKNSLPSTVIKVCTIFPSRCLTGLAPTLTSLICFELVFIHAIWSNLNLFPCLYPVFPALFAENIILSPHNGMVDTLWKSVSKRCLSSPPVSLLNLVIWSVRAGLLGLAVW